MQMWYWIACRKIDGKLTHKYLDRPTDVTLSWLEEVGTLLEWWNAADGSEWRWKIEFYNHI